MSGVGEKLITLTGRLGSFSSHKESGVEELRRLARVTGMCQESAFDGFTAEQCIKMIRACWASEWDILPDDLLPSERRGAARTGKLSKTALKRLEKALS